MFELNPNGCCGASCKPCQSFDPPEDPFEAFAWDCLGVQLIENSFVLRRCCSITTTLDAGESAGTYTAGQTVPFWQPEDVGPTLGETGSRALSTNRSVSLRLGLTPENTPDCSDGGNPATEGSQAFFVSGQQICARASLEYDSGTGPQYVTWPNLNQNWLGYVRAHRPEKGEAQRVWFEMASFANGEGDLAPWSTVVTWRLDTGQAVITAPTELHQSTNFLPLEVSSNSTRGVAGDGNGSRIAVGPDFRIHAFRRRGGGVAVERVVADFEIGDRWQKADRNRFVLYEDNEEANIWPCCWQWDHTGFFLEVQHFGQERTNIYRNGPFGRELITSAPGMVQPMHYQRRGTRHVFLATTITNTTFWTTDPAAQTLFDIDEAGRCGSVIPEGEPFIRFSTDPLLGGLAHFVLLGPEGEVVVVREKKIERLGERAWSLDIDNAFRSASITRGTYNGWYHVRGVDAAAGRSLYKGHLLSRLDPDLSGGTTTRTDSILIHPLGPDPAVGGGTMTPRQYSAPSDAPFDPATGNEEMHFVGHETHDEFRNERQWGLQGPDPAGFATGQFNADLPQDSFSYAQFAAGVSADPTLPANYGLRQ